LNFWLIAYGGGPIMSSISTLTKFVSTRSELVCATDVFSQSAHKIPSTPRSFAAVSTFDHPHSWLEHILFVANL
jgi:hypothetical protein